MLLILVPGAVSGQTGKATSKPPTELMKLREEYVRLTREYKASLGKLIPFYENDVKRAEEKLKQSRKYLSEGLIAPTQIEENERQLQAAKDKIADIKRQMDTADQQIAAVLNDPGFERDYKAAIQQRRKARKPRCTSWTMTASQRTTSNSIFFSYRFVCQN